MNSIVKNGLQFMIGTFFLAILSFQARADINSIEIRILPESIVYGDYYLLGDIAELDGFDIETIQQMAKIQIGKSPLPGRSHRIYRNSVQKRLKSKFSKIQVKIILPTKPIVSRASIKIDRKQLETIALNEIRKHYKDFEEAKITIKTKLKDTFIPKGNASYKMKRIGKSNKIGGYSSWMLSLMLDEKEAKKILIRAKIEVFDEVVVAKGKIDKGDLIEHSDLAKMKKDISKERKGYRSSPDLLVGEYARRDIFKSEAVRSNLVERPIIVKKGAHIRVFYQSPNMYLANSAIAMKSGKKGDIIPFRTLKSRKTIYAVVVDSKNAKVTL
ncbi:MAG: flagellar basal body P-ring formation protein FlgA [Proteobacteria bacterium]|nr:flagellar basal body P-ring formation protein FlgA [Pseudomonadota bacterium]